MGPVRSMCEAMELEPPSTQYDELFVVQDKPEEVQTRPEEKEEKEFEFDSDDGGLSTVLDIPVFGAWKGLVSLPKSATVKDLKKYISQQSKFRRSHIALAIPARPARVSRARVLVWGASRGGCGLATTPLRGTSGRGCGRTRG